MPRRSKASTKVPVANYDEMFLKEDDNIEFEDDSMKFLEENNAKFVEESNAPNMQSTPVVARPQETTNKKKSERFQCEVCRKDFVDDEHLRRHAKDHQSGKKPNIRRSVDMNNNMEKSGGTNYSSNQMLNDTPRRKSEEEPSKSTLPESSCGICRNEYPNVDVLKKHILTGVHGTDKCELCKLVFASVDFFTKHVMTVHGGVKSTSVTPVRINSGSRQIANRSSSKSPASKVLDPELSCAECKKQFLNKDYLQKHNDEVHGNSIGKTVGRLNESQSGKTVGRLNESRRNSITPPPPAKKMSFGQRNKISSYVESLIEKPGDDRSENETAAAGKNKNSLNRGKKRANDIDTSSDGVRVSKRARRSVNYYEDPDWQ